MAESLIPVEYLDASGRKHSLGYFERFAVMMEEGSDLVDVTMETRSRHANIDVIMRADIEHQTMEMFVWCAHSGGDGFMRCAVRIDECRREMRDDWRIFVWLSGRRMSGNEWPTAGYFRAAANLYRCLSRPATRDNRLT